MLLKSNYIYNLYKLIVCGVCQDAAMNTTEHIYHRQSWIRGKTKTDAQVPSDLMYCNGTCKENARDAPERLKDKEKT